MKRIYAFIAVMTAVSVLAIAGCQKQEAQKPAEQPAVATAAPESEVTPTVPAEPVAPEHK